MAEFHKKLEECFAVDQSKLQRIEQIMAARSWIGKIDYDLEFSDGSPGQAPSLADLVKQDNLLTNPIKSVTVSGGGTKDSRLSYCAVEFDRGGDLGTSVSLRIETEDAKEVTGLAAELQEQLERTFLRGPIYYLKRSIEASVLIAILVSLVGIVFAATLKESKPGALTLTPADVTELRESASKIGTTEDKLNFLVDAQSRMLRNFGDSTSARIATVGRALFSVRVGFVAVPLLFILGALVYIWRRYPKAVFQWGDCGARYLEQVAQRRSAWSAVVFAFVIGVLANIFAFAVVR